ncbi:MAG: fluoride efflux transporter CrcB [Bacteroidaceae bacterium]|nr:fluoride efflux transporter CrcB [Bacteroidaceae bacterium]MEA5099390.1 fluoride efflux transporter CrcB [Bacteroidales bacterium]
MKSYLLVALGGAIGSVSRFGISELFSNRTNSSFPWATLFINLLGCFLIGLLLGLSQRYQFASHYSLRSFFIIGLCGGFTTFSSFSAETMRLFQNAQNFQAIMYILASTLIGLALTLLGYNLLISR